MPSEAGDMKLMGTFRRLIDEVSADPTYNPSNALLAPSALETLYAAGFASVEGVANKLAPNKIAISERQIAFDLLGKLVVRSRNLLKAAGVSKEVLADANTFVRKLTGTRKSPKVKDNPATPENEAAANHSASQMSFDNRLGNFNSFIEILNNVSAYAPNETDLTTTALKETSIALKAKNDAVSSTFVPLSQARGLRDTTLYLGANSVVNTALLVKAYVSGAMGTGSQLNKQIKGLQFRRRT